ncbi:MAG: hypothetical protein RLZZ628_2031 [Bacteroidota bacterium]|jgi:hypothetical protein
MKVSNGLILAGIIGGYLYFTGKKIVNGLHSKIIRVRIQDFWNNLLHGDFVLELTWLLENQSSTPVTVNHFAGQLKWRGNRMASIDLGWGDAPIMPGQIQEIPFIVRGKFVDGIAAIILAVHNPGARILEGVTVEGTLHGMLNQLPITLPYHEEISITL